jgi:hypothetical protein
MIRFRAGCLGALLAFALISATADMALAKKQTQKQNENMEKMIMQLMFSLQAQIEQMKKTQNQNVNMEQVLRLMQSSQAQLRRVENEAIGKDIDLGPEILALRSQLEETQKTLLTFRETISGGQRERFFPDMRHRVAGFTFDDPHATGLGDPISFLLSKKLLFSSRVTSFAIVNYRQGADRDSSSDLAYFDRVDAVTKDQNFPLAVWGRLSHTDRGVRIDSFLQIPGDAEKSPYIRTIRLPAAMGGGTLTARLKPDRLLVQSLDVDYDKTSLLTIAADQVAMLRASPAAAAPVTGRLGDGNGSYSIVGSERDWVQLRLADGTSGWTSVDQFCTDICRALLDVANFANDVVALTSGFPARPMSKSLTREAEAMLQQLAALMSLPNNPNRAIEIAKRWTGVASPRAIASASAGFANILAVARVKAELARANAKGSNFDRIRLGRQAVERIANQLADASVADPSDVDVVENLAVLFGYLGDDRRRRLAVEIATNLKAKAH